MWPEINQGVIERQRGRFYSLGYQAVSAEAAWNLIQKARAARCNTRQAILMTSDGVDMGCSETMGDHWLNKMLQMYARRCSMAFFPADCYHLNVVADLGHHSYKDCLAGLAYSHEADVGCYVDWQHLLSGKASATPSDAVMPEDIQEFAATQKLQRVAAYRQLQGVSHQVWQLFSKQLTIDDFSLPEDCYVRATEPNEERVVEDSPCGRFDVAYFNNTMTNAKTRILPANLQKVRLLVLMLDQGPIGTAGVAFAAFHLKKNIIGKFHKIHRLIRDLKLAEEHCWPGQLFTKTKLWSSYLYSMNNRPFSSGATATLKESLLYLFRVNECGAC